MEDFAARVIAAHQAGLSERRSKEKRAQDEEEHKLNVQAHKLALDNAKFEQALHARQIQGMTSGGPTGQATTETPTIQPPPSAPDTITPPQASPDLNEGIQSLLMKIRQQPVAAQPMPIQGMSQSVETGTPPALPDIQTGVAGFPSIPGTNLELEKAKQMSDLLQAMKLERLKPHTVAEGAMYVEPSLSGGPAQVFENPKPAPNVDPNSPAVLEAKNKFAATENEKRLKAETERAAADRKSRELIANANRLQRASQASKTGTQSKTIQQAMTLSNRFDTNPIVKQYGIMTEANQFVNSLSPTTTNPADDQGLIYAFAKAMDPGSVVREGEYATVQKYSQSWADKFGFDVKRLYSNSPFLTPDARANMKATILGKAKASESNYNNLRDETAKKFKNIGEDPAGWLVDYGTIQPAPATGGGGSSAVPDVWTLPDGTIVRKQPDGTFK